MIKKASLVKITFLITTVLFLFLACDNLGNEHTERTYKWTFQEQIPGWVEFLDIANRRGDYPNDPNGTTMNLDAEYLNNMTLLASQRTIRWFPNAPSPAGSGFSNGYLMPNGRADSGTFSLKITNVRGPFTLTLNYTAREGQRSFPIIFVNEVEKLKGEETDVDTPKTITYEYEGSDVVTIQLGNANIAGSASAGIRIYDVILTSYGFGSGSGNGNGGNGEEPEKILAFPGAEGFGRYASGGRGGKVVAVTNLFDNAANPPEGSLRWALAQHPGEPITVIFRVSGNIELERYVNNSQRNELRVNRNNFTIAGHTAPGGGINISGNKVNFGGSNNFIIRHVRFRIGAVDEANGSIGIENASNFIIDHCSFGWSGEENMTVYDNKMSTIQWCIVHEGLFESGHDKGRRGYGTQWGGETATYHHNLLAHNDSRSPRFNGARSNDRNVLIDFVNNVNYNWGKRNSSYGAEIERESHRVNFVNNYFKPGPAFPGTSASDFVELYYAGNQSGRLSLWYMSGNIMEGSANTAKNTNNYLGLDMRRYPANITLAHLAVATPFEVPYPVTTETAQEAYNSVLAGAGAFPRDSVDTRIVNEVRNGTASGTGVSGKPGIIDNPSAVGGFPTYVSLPAPVDTDGDGIPDDWEIANGLNPNDPSDGAIKSLCETYTNLEVYLNELELIVRTSGN
ncbi:MAG: hypothetical protein LBC80_03385 [Treponema sp.]|jgi:pectate lyase|nr:hypothetical protein [Treponema sp.]